MIISCSRRSTSESTFYRHTCAVTGLRAALGELPLVPRAVTIGAGFLGVAGGIVGLVVGLFTYAPTAPVAMLELGLPATLAGGVLGTIAGLIGVATQRLTRR
jgi:hypothetical protein